MKSPDSQNKPELQSTTASGGNFHHGLLPTPTEIVTQLSKRVIGQERAKRLIADAAYQHLLAMAYSDIEGKTMDRPGQVMLVGPTGSGKTLMLTEICRILSVPHVYINCAEITPVGYKGLDLSQHFEMISDQLVDDGKTKVGFVILDEFDKVAIHDSVTAPYRRMVQSTLLTYLGGCLCGRDRELDSSRILNFACGAFTGLDEIRGRGHRNVAGFHTLNTSHAGAGSSPAPLLPEHLIQFGMLPELMGRFSSLAALKPLEREDYRRLITDAEGSVLESRKAFFALHGVDLQFDNDAIDSIVEYAMKHPTGARGLHLVIDRVLGKMIHRLPELARHGLTRVIYDRDSICGKRPPSLEHGRINGPIQVRLLKLRSAAMNAEVTTREDEDDEGDLCIF